MLKFLSLTHELMLILTHSERLIKAIVIMITTVIISFWKARLPAVLNKQLLATRSEGLGFHLVLSELVSQHPLIYASSGKELFRLPFLTLSLSIKRLTTGLHISICKMGLTIYRP